MQNKGALRFLAIVLALACAYQLSFTFVTMNVESKAAKYAAGDPAKEQIYLDSMQSQTVYNLGFMKYTYGECQDKEINLGLDLKGGMNVMLEIAVEDVLRALSSNSSDEDFNKAMAAAKLAQRNSTDDFITLFAREYEKINPTGQLSLIFSSPDLREKITYQSTNPEVVKVLREECESAISNSFNVLRNRIDRFGVTQPNIQRLENSRILVELPGVKDPERVRKLLQGTASLEFWTTYLGSEITPFMAQANQIVAEMAMGDAITADTTALAISDAAAQDSVTSSLIDEVAQNSATPDEKAAVSGSLFSLMQPMNDNGPVVAIAQAFDTAAINKYLAMPKVRAVFPRDVRFMWAINPLQYGKQVTNNYELYAIKVTSNDGKAPLDGGSIVDAVGEFGQNGSSAEVSMVMNAKGAATWSRLTADNIGRFIGIVLDNYVYSCPRVQAEIAGGRSQITGNFTINEAKDLANVLKSGKLPAPARIIQDTVVGPSLGKESITAGMMSFILAFVLVLIYMSFYYNTAGFVSNIALVTNLFFLFGVLVSFGAVLTLPGIAGIVLTMGMAVDANVIIYERIKEEVRAGKGVSLSITDGYKNAYSAIIDGNVTTLITGIVLFIFGTGPVQGFATTLIIGILTSLFTSIFITRLIFASMLTKERKIRFSNKFTENFLEHAKFDFIKMRKYTYIISIALFLITVGSFAIRGVQYGVDFSGGRSYVVRFDQNVTATEVRGALDNVFTSGFEVKQYGPENQMRIVTQYKYADEGDNVTHEINMLLYDALSPLYKTKLTENEFLTTEQSPFGILSSDKVGPSVAHDIKINAFIAVIFSLIMIGLYIALRFQKWQWGMGGVVSLLHDAIITVGIFSLFYGVLPFNLEIDQAFIAAILTIIGYSINDTVVIFDRIREYRTIYPKRDVRDNINQAINSTLARTINTAGTTVVVLLAIFIFGGEVIRGFVFALLFGVIIGTFSSVFVATPVAYDMMRHSDKKKAKQLGK